MDIMREITSLWQTDELRRHKPTPVDGEHPSYAHLSTLTFPSVLACYRDRSRDEGWSWTCV